MDPKDAEIAQLQRQLDVKAEAERRWRMKFHRLSSQMHHSPSKAHYGEDEEEEGRAHTALRSPARSSTPASPSLTSIVEEADDDGVEVEQEQQRQRQQVEGELRREQRELRIRSQLLALHHRLSLSQMKTATVSKVGCEEGDAPSTTQEEALDMETLVEELRSPSLTQPHTDIDADGRRSGTKSSL